MSRDSLGRANTLTIEQPIMKPTGDAEFAADVAAWNDSYLRSQYAAGPAAFQSGRWEIIHAEFAKRGLQPAHEILPAPTPWFFVSRLAGTRWPPNTDLPMTYLKFAVFVGALYAMINAAELVTAASDYFGYHVYPDEARSLFLIALMNTAWSALFPFALASRRPWGWHYAMFATGLVAMASFVAFFPEGTPDLSRAFAALIWCALMWLYLARRRRQFGLSPWPMVM